MNKNQPIILNKIQKIIITISIISFIISLGSYYWKLSLNPIGWLRYKKASQAEMDNCLIKLKEQREKGFTQPFSGVQSFSEWQKSHESLICDPSRSKLFELHPKNPRERHVEEILLLDLTIGTVLILALFLTRNVKKWKRK